MSCTARKKLQGPRPPPLMVKKASTEIVKKPKSTFFRSRRERRSPVIIYLRSPKIIHVRPEEFKSFVQRFTGNQTHLGAVVASSSASRITPPGEELVAARRRSFGHMPVDCAADPSSFGSFQPFIYS